jgi:hypothetical protein
MPIATVAAPSDVSAQAACPTSGRHPFGKRPISIVSLVVCVASVMSPSWPRSFAPKSQGFGQLRGRRPEQCHLRRLENSHW